MSENLCIARAYGDEPVCRLVVGVYRKLVYLAAASSESAGGLRGKGAVGFPRQFVFEFDKPLFDGLCEAYRAGDTNRLGKLWGQAKPIPNSMLDTFLKQSA